MSEVKAVTLATVIDADPAHANMTHAEIAEAINAQTAEIPRAVILLNEIYEQLDPAEIAKMETGTAVGFWRLLEQGQFEIDGKPFALFLAICPPNSRGAIQVFVATPKTIPLRETLGFSRPLDSGDISAIKGHEMDFFDAISGENQCASGLTKDQRAAIVTANGKVDAKTLVSSYTKRQLDIFIGLSPETLTACGVDPAAVDTAKALQASINTIAKANPDIDVSDMTHAELTAEVNS